MIFNVLCRVFFPDFSPKMATHALILRDFDTHAIFVGPAGRPMSQRPYGGFRQPCGDALHAACVRHCGLVVCCDLVDINPRNNPILSQLSA
jgi:hypothetical protein